MRKKPKFEGLSLVWLEAFVLVAQTEKRTAAAAEMGIHQGTVTKHIQKLERWLGGRMLLNDNIPVGLMPDGERFLPVAKQILQLLDEARLPQGTIETAATSPTPRISGKDLRLPPSPPQAGKADE